jgi:cytochrome c biogenesis protein CcdA
MAGHGCPRHHTAVIALVALVVSIALVDSVNPTTVVPALYLATGRHPGRAVTGFAAGFFVVNVAGGLVVLAVGARAVDALPHVRDDALGASEIAVGVVAVVAGALLWHRRHAASARIGRSDELVRRVAPAAGAALAAVELPTALPYFAALALLTTSGQPAAVQVVLVLGFNLVFLAPVFVIAIVATLARRRTEVLESVRLLVVRHSGAAAATLLSLVGLALIALGVHEVADTL